MQMRRVRCTGNVNGSKYLKDISIIMVDDALRAAGIAKTAFANAYDLRSRDVRVVRIQ